jgi:cytosine/uracil/thiamine/allantoin permease
MPSLLVVKIREKKYRVKLPWWYEWKWFVGVLLAAILVSVLIVEVMKP